MLAGIGVLAVTWNHLPEKYIGYFTNPNWDQGRTWFQLLRAGLVAILAGIWLVKRRRKPEALYRIVEKIKISQVVWDTTVASLIFTLQVLPSPFSRVADLIWIFFFWWALTAIHKVRIERHWRWLLTGLFVLAVIILFVGIEQVFNYHGMFPYRLMPQGV